MSERLLIATTALALLALAEAAESPAYAAEDPSDRVRSPTAKTLQIVQADAQLAPLVPPVPQPARRPAQTAAPEPQLAPLIPPVPQPAVRPLRLAAIPEPQLAPLIPPVPQLARRPLKRDSKSIRLLACLKPAARELLDRIEGEFGPMEIISTCRPGARIAGTGRVSKHASGEAIDFEAGSRKGDVVRWLIANHKTGGTMTYSDMSHVHVDVGQYFVALNAYSGR
jgi:hypothetical protein